MIKKTIGILFFTTTTLALQAQIRKYSNEFLSIGVGARGMGMAGAQSAVTNDVTSAYWNPAGLIHVDSDIQVGLMHSEYFAGIAKYDYAAISAPIDRTSVASVTMIRFAVDDIPDTSELFDAGGGINYDRIKSFSSADYAFLFSYAKEHATIEGLTLGGSAKIIYRGVGQYAKAYGFGFDVGLQLKRPKYTIGLMGRDITSTFNAWTFNVDKLREVFAKTNNEIPQNGLELTLPQIVAGGCYKYDFTEKLAVLGTADLNFTFDGKRNTVVKTSFASIEPRVGLEVGYANLIFLRGGIGNIQKVKNLTGGGESTIFQPNVGAGIKLKQFTLDYAFTNIGQTDVPYSHVISLKVDINRHITHF
jgi:hypothetical protein